jgi:hypothetical protein
MQKTPNLPLKILISQLLIFTISLLDDLLLLALAQWGLHHPWLHWLRHLAPILLGCTVLYSLWQLRHFQFQTQKATWNGNSLL